MNADKKPNQPATEGTEVTEKSKMGRGRFGFFKSL